MKNLYYVATQRYTHNDMIKGNSPLKLKRGAFYCKAMANKVAKEEAALVQHNSLVWIVKLVKLTEHSPIKAK
jgi:hypothetical protein